MGHLAVSTHQRKLEIYTDGAARGNPGPSASGYAIFENGKIIKKDAFYNGRVTNNIAEYKAIIEALEWCLKNVGDAHETKITLNSDSELAIRQLNREYKTKSTQLKALYRRASELAAALGNVIFVNLRREDKHISAVDKALNILLDKHAIGNAHHVASKPST